MQRWRQSTRRAGAVPDPPLRTLAAAASQPDALVQVVRVSGAYEQFSETTSRCAPDKGAVSLTF